MSNILINITRKLLFSLLMRNSFLMALSFGLVPASAQLVQSQASNLLVNGAEVWSTGSLEDSGEWTIEMDRVKEPSGSYQLHIRYASESTRRFGYHQLAAELASDLVMNLKTSAFIDEDVIIRANLSSGSVDNER